MRLAPVSATGLALGTIFFAFSLTPSLEVREQVAQGVISGLSFTAGYGLGAFGCWLWAYLGLPLPGRRAGRVVRGVTAAACGLIAAAFLWRATAWQDALRELMGTAPRGGAHLLTAGLIAALVFAALLTAARVFRGTFRWLSHRLQPYVPRRVSQVIGVMLAVALFWAMIDGVLFTLALRAADSSFRQVDALIEDDVAPAADPMQSGGPASLVAWHDLGRHGRAFVSATPGARRLSRLSGGKPARAPLRVYVGLNSADDPAGRARLALRELERVGAFERSVLILVTPTGSGWIDPAAVETVEALHHGDVASVAVQYSYLPSALSLMVESAYGAETARALFNAVYGRWKALPAQRRPALYAYGLSLGALNSDRSFDLFDVIGDPPQGALWVGPPFRSETWRTVTGQRDESSPAWLPRFRDGTVVRFMNQYNSEQVTSGGPWGPLRILYLQHTNDAVTFFCPDIAFRSPAWLTGQRGPGVSPDLRWFPVVTMLQLAADIVAGSAPPGHGHQYAARHYIDAWVALTEPPGWSAADLERLKAAFAGR